jgi:hypothetical protein
MKITKLRSLLEIQYMKIITQTAANAPPNEITTSYKIGKTTFLVTARHSEKAKESIGKKVERLIMRDIEKISENGSF